MGGCFPCFGSSNKDSNGVKEVAKKDSVKESSANQSHHVTIVSSGNPFLFCFRFWRYCFLEETATGYCWVLCFLFVGQVGML